MSKYLNFCLDFLVMWKNGLIRLLNLVNKQLQYKYWLISQLVKPTSQWNYSQTLSWTIKIEHISGSVAYNFKYFVFIVWKVVDYRHVLKRGCRPLALNSYKSFLKKTKTGQEVVSLPHFLNDFWRKIFILLYSINWPNFIIWLPLLRKYWAICANMSSILKLTLPF